MRKSDVLLLVATLLVNTIFLFAVFESDKASTAYVYYDNNYVMEIDLSNNEVYRLDGDNGEIELTVKDGKIAVTKETSPLNICSKQGYVDVNKIPLICLPNKVSVEGSSSDSDGVAR